MAQISVGLRLDRELLEQLDKVRGEIPRNRWITGAIVFRLALGLPSAPVQEVPDHIPSVVKGSEVPVPVQDFSSLPRDIGTRPSTRPGKQEHPAVLDDPDRCGTINHNTKRALGGTCPDCGRKFVKK